MVNENFPITIRLHQGSTLHPYLYTLVLDVLTKHIQELASRSMLFCKWRSLVGWVEGGIERDARDLET